MTTNIKQIYKIFPTEDDCIKFLEAQLWNDTPLCPYCGVSNYSETSTLKRYHCNTCNSTFSVTVKTIFHRTKCDLRKWFFAIYLFARPLKKITARDLGKLIGSTKDTAWLMMAKISAERVRSEILFNKIIDAIENKKQIEYATTKEKNREKD